MGLLTTADKEKVKRVIPKANNKVIDATVARLYIAYPNPNEWKYTDLYGAVCLVDDLVGHTFFLKLVDIVGHRGVIWDQEIYVDFGYNQDRKFFHSFETEDCYMGLLFEDTTEASHFYKKVTTRQKHGSKQTINNKNTIALKKKTDASKKPLAPGPRGEFVDVNTGQRSRHTKGVLYYDDVPPPEWRSLYSELANAGITEDMIADNREFIKDYISKQGGPLVGLEPPIPRRSLKKQEQELSRSETVTSHTSSSTKKKAPPPPPPGGGPASSATIASPIDSPSYTPEPSAAPTPPPINAPAPANDTASGSETPSEPESPPEPKPTRQFRLPPSTATAPPVSHSNVLPPPPGGLPQTANGYVQPPTQYGQPPSQYGQAPSPYGQRPSQYGQPPAQYDQNRPLPPPGQFQQRGVPPPPPSRGNAPPPPPSRGNAPPPPARAGGPPPMPPNRTGPQSLPPRGPMPPARTGPPAPPPPRRGNVPPPPPSRGQTTHAAPPPSLPPHQPQTSFTNMPPPPMSAMSNSAPPPPPMPPMSAMSNSAPPPPPPPMPPMGGASEQPSAPAIPPSGGDSRDALLASIRGAGIGALKKTDKSNLEKPSVLLQEARGEKVDAPSTSTPAAPGAPVNFADAIQNALNQRKAKISRSDDEDDGDDW